MNLRAALRDAFGYFSVLPAGGSDGPPSPDAVALLPLVGMTLGAASGALAAAAARVATPQLGRGFACTLPIVLSGALHADGFLDVCDALFAPVSPERRREILRDPRHGTFAVAGMSVVATLGFTAVASIPPRRWPLALAFAEGTGRLAALLVALDAANAPGTAAGAFAEPPAVAPLAMQAAAVLALAFATGGFRLVAGTAATCLGSRVAARAIAPAFGGTIGGDVYGFTVVTAQLAALALAATFGRERC